VPLRSLVQLTDSCCCSLYQVNQKQPKRQKGAAHENEEEEAMLQLEAANAAIARRDAEIAARAAEIEELRAALQEFNKDSIPASTAAQAEKKYGLRDRKVRADPQEGTLSTVRTAP
jgi:phage-related tail protein